MQTQAKKQIARRILDKAAAYASEDLSRAQKTALDIFFDLSLETESIREFKSLCVLIPDLLLGVQTSLYLRDKNDRLHLRRTTNIHAPHFITFSEPICPSSYAPLKLDEFIAFPLCEDQASGSKLLGVYCIHKELDDQETAFFWNFVHKAAKMLRIKQTAILNKHHLTFINNLVRDIGHNVIVPNMYFKLLFLRMEKLLSQIRSLTSETAGIQNSSNTTGHETTALLRELQKQLASASKRFQQSSLFLESLLRSSHFEKGHYDLIKKPCKFKSQIIEPQIERYSSLFQEQQISVQVAPEVRIDDDITLEADLGLISQVFANLLSNAVKYTQQVPSNDASSVKEVLYGWERLPHALGANHSDVRLFVSTTGTPVPPREAARLFEANFRSEEFSGTEGTGHGLYFVKQIVELHGGKVGYVHQDAHNIFYLTLPCSAVPDQEQICRNPS